MYSPLDSTKHQIRLLHLQPSLERFSEATSDRKSIQKIRCSFSLVSLQDDAEYEALSYVWGKAEATASILLNEMSFPVTGHLESILYYLRYRDRERILWIDALCIDQNSISERSQQVSVMHEIYSEASQVVAYLGDAWEGVDSAFKIMAFAGSHPDLHWITPSGPSIRSYEPDLESPLHSDSFARILAAPWWTRLWTVQEFLLARRVIFMCGKHTFRAHDLKQFLRYCVVHNGNCCGVTDSINPPSSGIYKLNETFITVTKLLTLDTGTKFASSGFSRVVSLFRSRECSDPCDKIYALLGMTSAELRASISIDYNRSTSDLYSEVTTAASKQGLEFLSWLYGTRNESLKLPSWVLDISTPLSEFANMCFATRVTVSQDLFCATRDSRAAFNSIGSGKATTSTVFLDRISHAIPRPAIGLKGHFKERRREWVDECWDVASTRKDSSEPYSCRTCAFWRTLCGSTGAKVVAATSPSHRLVTSKDKKVFNRWNAHIRTDMYRNRTPTEDKEVRKFDSAFNIVTVGRNFAITERGYIGWVPSQTQKGDWVVLFSGGRVPYIIREVSPSSTVYTSDSSNGGTGYYEFLGDTYIHGIMHGEAYDETKIETITLV